MGLYRAHSFSARGKNWNPITTPRSERSEFSSFRRNPIPQQSSRSHFVLLALFRTHATQSRATAAGRARPPTHQTSPPLQPPTATAAAAAAAADGEDERGRAVRGADGAGVRRGGPAGRGRAGVAVPVRGGAPAACLDLLLPPALQRPLPVPPGPVSKWFPSPLSHRALASFLGVWEWWLLLLRPISLWHCCGMRARNGVEFEAWRVNGEASCWEIRAAGVPIRSGVTANSRGGWEH